MSFTLQPISRADLQVLADAGVPDGVAGRTADGALPPPFVAKRSLGQLAQGQVETGEGDELLVQWVLRKPPGS